MWKKIRSNRSPDDTVYSEIRKEFSPYFEKAGVGLTGFLQKFPKGIFFLMVVLMAASLVMTLTIFRHPEQKAAPVTKIIVHPLNDGFDQILRAGAQLKETIRLKKIVDSISAKKRLSAVDSITLVQALDSLQKIHPSLR